MNKILFFLFILGILACKQSATTESADPTTPATQSDQQVADNSAAETQAVPRNDVPIAADFIDNATMEDFLGLEEGAIYDVVKNLNPSNKNNNSIFYKIEDPDLGNAAVMIVVSKNPLPDDISDSEFASYYINNKINDGERTLNSPDDPVKFETWDIGISGAYNKDIGKYYWRDKDNNIYLFATNVTIPIEKQYQAALKVAKTITPE